jgi:TP901 family phage tail tape measure protein
MAAPAAILSILVNANTGPAIQGLVRVNSQLQATDKASQKAAKSIGKIALAGAAIGGAAVVGGLAYATKKAADFEEQMSRLGAVADATDKQMERFRKQALKAGADTKFSALEAAAAQTELAKGGLSVQQIMRGGLRSALALAAAGEMELADAAEATVNAIKLFGLRGKDAMKVADGFATAANRTTADVSDFALALKAGGGAAKAAGLNFIETTALLSALAEVGVKGSDAGTSLKAALSQLAAPSEKQAKAARRLNLEFFDQQGNIKGLAEMSEMLRDRLGGLTNQQRLQAIKTVAGTDGMRTLLALYDAGPRKIQGMEAALGKQGTAADVARKKQDNLKGSLETLQGSIETLGIQIGTGMLPMIRTAADELTEFANDIGKIVGRKDLSVGEKLQKSLDLAQVRAKPWVDKLGAALEEANIPEKIGRVISAAVPIIAEAFAKGAPMVAGAFIKGFLAADIWGRLAIAGWLLARMGGPPAFLRAGTTAGVAMGTGMGAGMTKGVAAAGVKGKLMGILKAWGPSLALGLAAVFGPELAKALGKAVNPKTLEFALPKERNWFGQGLAAAIDLNPFNEKAKAAEDRLRAFGESAEGTFSRLRKASNVEGMDRLASQARKLAEEFPSASGALRSFANRITQVSERKKDVAAVEARVMLMGENVRQALRRTRVQGGENWDQMVNLVTQGSRKMLRTGGENSKKTRQAIHEQFSLAARKVQDAMDRKVISVKEGTGRLRELARKELKLYGISAGRVDVVLARGANGQMRPHQKGSYINEGRASGDSVPALLERGEYVLNRNAVKKVG